jgi:hypothetical protein
MDKATMPTQATDFSAEAQKPRGLTQAHPGNQAPAGFGQTCRSSAKVVNYQISATDPKGTNLSPERASSHIPGQAPAPPWVMGEKRSCPVGAAFENRLKLVSFATDPIFPTEATRCSQSQSLLNSIGDR